MNRKFWMGKRVLVTGHTGFKGSWLTIWLLMQGADVIGYSLEPKHAEDNFNLAELSGKITDIRGDIRNKEQLQQVCLKYQPEIVFHLAAQPIVLTSYENPYETYEINVMGTMNVLEAVRNAASVQAAVMITTDKVYENRETLVGYKETDSFGGYDPYSSSKACDEILISSYRNSFFPIEKYAEHGKAIASVRAGNVIGGGDWADYRIIPDCVRAIENGEQIEIRNRNAVRPWQHVLEPLAGYMEIAQGLCEDPQKYSGGWNFGPEQNGVKTVWDVASMVDNLMNGKGLKDNSEAGAVHEAQKLVLDITKAKENLQWKPKLTVEEAVEWTAEWYQKRKVQNVYELCRKQIESYLAK